MKHIILYIILALIGLSLFITFFPMFNQKEDIPPYYFKNFDVNINVKENNSYHITETVDVFFKEKRHGLIWKIPRKTYLNRYAWVGDGRVEGYNFKTTYEPRQYLIKIGDSDVWVAGEQKYKISYTYNLGYDALSKMDELYYDIIGIDHNVPKENVTFTITMPKEFDSSKLNFTYGQLGSINNSGVEYTVIGNRIKGTLKEGLGPNEVLTIALPLPEGYFVNTWRDRNYQAKMGDHYAFAYIFILVLAVILWGIYCKNRKIFPTIEFYAPKDLNPSEMGYIYDGEVDPYDITALIIYWANKNKIIIEETIQKQKGVFKKKNNSTITFHKIENLDNNFRQYEKDIFNSMFNICGDGKKVSIDELKAAFGRVVSSKTIIHGMQEKKETRIFSRVSMFVSYILKILCFLNALWFCHVIEYGIFKNTEGGIIGFFFAIFLCIPIWIFTSVIKRWHNIIPRFRYKKCIKRFFWVLVTFIGMLYISYTYSFPLMFVSGYMVCFLISLLSSFGLKRTLYGDRQMETILGFKQFIENAEKDRILLLVEDNPGYFFHILPYAMALGITDKWARRFDGILLNSPDWYYSSSLVSRSVYAYSFTREFTSNTNIIAESITSAISAATTNTSSSSSSSGGGWGGSSGGGSAGGGSGGSGSDDW